MSLMPIFAPVAATAYRMDLASDDNVSFSLRSGGALINGTFGITWRPDGMKFFSVERSNAHDGYIYHYDCSVAWNIATASYAGRVSLGTPQRYQGVVFNGDGAKVFIPIDGVIISGALSPAYTGAYSAVRTDSMGTGGVASMFFNDAGTEVFYTRSGALRKRALSSAFDMSTMGSETTVNASVSGRVSVGRGGTRLLMVNGGDIEEYGGSAYDFGSFTLRNTYTPADTPEYATYSANGRKIHTTYFFTARQYSTVN